MGAKWGVAVVCVVGALACSGEQGEPGAVGMNGSDGKDGAQGSTGEQGPPGEQGLVGDKGPAGEQGEPGVAGPVGAQGLPGDKGDKGDKGDPGEPAGGAGAGGAGAGGADSGADAPLHAPGLVLLDKNGEPAHAWLLQNYLPPYGESFDQSCVRLEWIEQRAAWELQLDLASGKFEPCYTAYASWTEAAKSIDAASFVTFHSADCTGPAYSPFVITTRLKVAGVLQEAHGAALAPIGFGTGEPASRYEGNVCKDLSNQGQPFTDLRAFVPIDPEFVATFDAPPYSVKVVY